jgi:hypothetical protein
MNYLKNLSAAAKAIIALVLVVVLVSALAITFGRSRRPAKPERPSRAGPMPSARPATSRPP